MGFWGVGFFKILIVLLFNLPILAADNSDQDRVSSLLFEYGLSDASSGEALHMKEVSERLAALSFKKRSALREKLQDEFIQLFLRPEELNESVRELFRYWYVLSFDSLPLHIRFLSWFELPPKVTVGMLDAFVVAGAILGADLALDMTGYEVFGSVTRGIALTVGIVIAPLLAERLISKLLKQKKTRAQKIELLKKLQASGLMLPEDQFEQQWAELLKMLKLPQQVFSCSEFLTQMN